MEYETRTGIDESILKIYLYGSRVYGCHTKDSDFDFIVVVRSDNDDLYYTVDTGDRNLTVYSEQMFIKKIKEHHISALECIFQDKDDPYLKYFELHLPTLRRSISAVASNSFGKAGKKMKQGDIYIGKKSLFHSIRILGCGIQIAVLGRIERFDLANDWHKSIMENKSVEWEDYKAICQGEYNLLKSSFKALAPLESGGSDE